MKQLWQNRCNFQIFVSYIIVIFQMEKNREKFWYNYSGIIPLWSMALKEKWIILNNENWNWRTKLPPRMETKYKYVSPHLQHLLSSASFSISFRFLFHLLLILFAIHTIMDRLSSQKHKNSKALHFVTCQDHATTFSYRIIHIPDKFTSSISIITQCTGITHDEMHQYSPVSLI